jgi:tetratricopeptide (TPR) repeat protein
VLWRFVLFAVVFFSATGVSGQRAAQRRLQGPGITFEIRGSVYGVGGAALPAVRVRLDSLTRGIVGFTDTNSSGQFAFRSLPPDSYVLVIEAAGYQPLRWPVEVGGLRATGLRFTLRRMVGVAPKGSSPTVSVRQLLIPDKARKEYRKGIEKQAGGQTDEAIRHLKKAIEIYPDYAESFMQLSKIFADQGDFTGALEAAKRAVAIADRNPDAYNCLGYVYLKKHEFGKAKEALEKAIQFFEPDWFAHFKLGALLLQEKDFAAAYPHLVRAHQLRPELANVHLLLYNTLVLLDRRAEALAEIDEFLERFPHDPRSGKIREKREALAKSIAATPH